MGKGGSAKVEVTYYYLSIHYGISIPVDSILSLTIKEKTAWTGNVSTLSSFELSLRDIFGGDTKEGGLIGRVTFLPGATDQVLPDELAVRQGRANGADCVGYRGVSSLYFHREGAQTQGFYWGANNPFVPGCWVTVQRVFKDARGDPQWYQAKAGIPRPHTGENVSPPYPTIEIAVDAGGADMTFSPDFRTAILGGYYGVSLIDTVNDEESLSLPGSFLVLDDNHLPWENGGFLASTSSGDLYSYTAAGVATAMGYSSIRYLCTVRDRNGIWHWAAVNGSNVYFDGADLGALDLNILNLFCDSENVVWLVALVAATSDVRFIALAGTPSGFPPDFTIDNADIGGATLADAGIEYEGYFIFGASNQLFKIDADLNVVGSVAVARLPDFKSVDPDSTTIWAGRKQISLADFSVVQEINPMDWGWSLAADAELIYDARKEALAYTSGSVVVWFLLPTAGVYDMNPAHIIRECLTDTTWGMGTPEAAVDDTSFLAAADTLYDEGFGLSLLWTRQAEIQAFVQEILDHIQAVLFVDPSNGLLTLSLIRGDYDAETLEELTPDNADLTDFRRKLWGEIVNEISVTWTNPDNEQEETVTAHDLASIAMQGGVVSDSRNYYGVRYAELAQALAWRDLRSAGQPLASCDATVDRSQWQLRPASVVKLTWPEYGLSEIVMRVVSIDYGRPGDPTIKLSLIEDVYGLDIGTYESPPASEWVDPTSEPEVIEFVDIITLPLFIARQTTVAEFVETPEYPEVVAGILASTDNTDTYEYQLWDEVTLTTGDPEWQSIGTNPILGRALLAVDLEPEASTAAVTFTGRIGQSSPTVGGFAIIGDAGETGNEIALVTAAGASYTLKRGTLDTVPRAWPIGTPVWFVDESTLLEDRLVRSAAEDVSYKLLGRTSLGTFPFEDAPLEAGTLTERPWLPNRPANVTAYGEAWTDPLNPLDVRSRAYPWVTVTWAIRNRLDEDAIVLGWTDASGTAEPGQTTTIEVRAMDGALLDTHDGLASTTFDVPDASFGVEAFVELRVFSERSDDDGDFVSLQHFSHWLWVGGVGRTTEDDAPRLTETGSRRLLED